jgi:hypothetical protein
MIVVLQVTAAPIAGANEKFCSSQTRSCVRKFPCPEVFFPRKEAGVGKLCTARRRRGGMRTAIMQVFELKGKNGVA